MHFRIRSIFYISAILSVFGLVCSCANIGTPSGGPRDEDPPVFVSANPAPGSLGVSKTKMVLTFNELINVKDAFQNVVVSPTSKSVPRVTSLGKRITVDFDSLQPNTTYTVDFGNAIEDNNEGNKLQGFSYTFATGETLDSLRISGRVLGARDLEPRQNMIVGVHADLADSAFTTKRLLRVAKTDDRGQFTIRGLAPGRYRVFALGDLDNDYRYSSPEEDIAFYDVTVDPNTETVVATDTVWNKKTGVPDTVVNRERTRFLPNDVLLRTFNSEKRTQYLSHYERLDSTRLFLKFNTLSEQLPHLDIVGGDKVDRIGWVEASQQLDSVVVWLPKALVKTDSLVVATTYLRTDSTQRLSQFTDTLNFFTKKLPVKKNKKESKQVRKISATDSIAAITTSFNMLTSAAQDVHKPLVFEAKTPLVRFDTTAVHLSVMVDTVFRRLPGTLKIAHPDSLSIRHYMLDYPWEYGTKYKLEIDSLAGTDIYDMPTRPLVHEFTAKEAGEYCSLVLNLSGYDNSVPAFVELLNGSDAVQRVAPVMNGEAFFPFLTPGKYYARFIEDYNGNGVYDTGDYDERRQPEIAYYYPKAINIKKNWDKEENWDIFGTPVDQMKPVAILKNKPAASKRGRKNRDDENVQEEDDDYFDPNSNPFDPNDKQRRNRNKRIHN